MSVILVMAMVTPVVAPLNTFGDAEVGKLPPGWSLSRGGRANQFHAKVVDGGVMQGRKCLELEQKEYVAFGTYGIVSTTIDAKPYRGKRVRWQMNVRVQAKTARTFAAPFCRILRPDGRPGHWSNRSDRGVRTDEWQDASVVVDVADDAMAIELGGWLNETGRARFDDGQLAVLGPAGEGNIGPRALSERGLENLMALARLVGYVRYFHPSDEVALADWDRTVEAMLAEVESAASREALIEQFHRWVLPLAPTVHVFPTDRPPAPMRLDEPAGARRIAWLHDGIASNYQTRGFSSVRVVDRALAGRAKGGFAVQSPFPHDPNMPGVYEIGAGLSCRVPHALFLTPAGTVAKPTAKIPATPRSEDFPRTGDDRTTRLTAVIVAWSMLQHSYPYFEEVSVRWGDVLAPTLKEAAIAKDAAEFHTVLRRLCAGLRDGHGMVRGGSGTVGMDGVLPLTWDLIEGQLVVTTADVERAKGLRRGDVITRIDGVPVKELLQRELPLAMGATPQFRVYRTIQSLRNGPEGSSVRVEARDANMAKTVTLTREWADDSPLRGPSLREHSLSRVQELKPGYWYIDLDRIDDRLFAADVVPILRKAEGIVVDLRGYPKCDPRLFSWLCPGELKWIGAKSWLVQHPDLNQVVSERIPIAYPKSRERLSCKAAFLIDAKPVSYGETCAEIVSINKLGPLVGSPTAGTNGGAQLYALPGGYIMSWTGAKVVQADGKPFHGVGVAPTHPVNRTIAAVRAGKDEALDRAIQLLLP